VLDVVDSEDFFCALVFEVVLDVIKNKPAFTAAAPSSKPCEINNCLAAMTLG